MPPIETPPSVKKVEGAYENTSKVTETPPSIKKVEEGSNGVEGTSLCDAVTQGDLELVESLLKEGRDPNTLSTDWYRTRPLIIAANAGHASIVTRLLQHPDIQPNLVDGVFGNTALMGACQEGHNDVVKRMVANPKVDLKFQTEKTGTTALMEASRYGHGDTLSLLIGPNSAKEDLAGVNLQTKTGTTALMLGCMAHRDKVLWGAKHIKMLLGVGALDVDIKDSQGRNAEDWSRDKNLDYVKKLIKEASVHNTGGGEARLEMLQLREKVEALEERVEELEVLLEKSEDEKKELEEVLEERERKDAGADLLMVSTKDAGAGGDLDEVSTKDVGAGGDFAHISTKDVGAGDNLELVTEVLAAQAL